MVEQSITRLLDAGTASSNGLALTVMCVCLNSPQLVNTLLCALLNRRSLAIFIQRSSNKPAVKLLHDRISEAISAVSTKFAFCCFIL